jgi:hemerythrin-like domain-containing protein
MKPRGPLMVEHRLIERMLKVAEKEIGNIKRTNGVSPLFIDTVVDFIKTYADRTHHGKEEDILFRDLKNKTLSAPDGKIMKELTEDHAFARKIVGDLVAAKTRFAGGDKDAVNTIREKLAALISFYHEHIKKEDAVFFPNTEKYFTSFELDGMLNEFREFDRKMIHEKYREIVKKAESLTL